MERSVERVIENTGMMGRWQVLSKEPLCIADTGHNEDGLTALMQQIAETSYKHLHFVLGMVNDKDIEKLLSLLPKDATYYFCKADIPRALEAKVLFEKAQTVGLTGSVFASVLEAYDAAKQSASSDDLVFVGGSTFVVAEVV